MATNIPNKMPNYRALADVIEKIALRNLVDSRTGAVRNTERVTGYVAKINTEGELAGTIDVQEFATDEMTSEEAEGEGYHEGVYLSAIQDNSNGMVVIPKLYSEVVIVRDPVTKVEYVSMFSHVDVVKIDAHDQVSIGVQEREEYNVDDDDAPDVDELETTGVAAVTTYTKNSIVSAVQVDDDAKATRTITSDTITDNIGSSTQTIKDGNIVTDVDGTVVSVKSGHVYLGKDGASSHAVLGEQLADILSSFLSYMSQMMTNTMLGPQPPMNVANFIALKAKVDAYKSSCSGFLSKTVNVAP